MTKGANCRNNKTTKRSRISEVFPATFTYEFEDGTEAESDVLHRSGRSSRTKKTKGSSIYKPSRFWHWKTMRRGRHRHIPTGKRLTKHCYVLCFTHTAAQNADIYSVLKQTPFLGVALSGTATVKILKNSGVSSFEPDFLYFFRCMINVKHKLEFKVRRRPKPSQNAVKHSNSKTTMRFTYVKWPPPSSSWPC